MVFYELNYNSVKRESCLFSIVGSYCFVVQISEVSSVVVNAFPLSVGRIVTFTIRVCSLEDLEHQSRTFH